MNWVRLLHDIGKRLPGRRLAEPTVARVKRGLRVPRARRYRDSQDAPVDSPRILVCMQEGIGNAVEATPMVAAFRSAMPRAHITILTPPGDLFEGWCVVDREVHAGSELAGARFDHTFIAWSASLPAHTPASCDFGRVHYPRCLLYEWLLAPEREYNMRLARAMGYRGDAPPPFVAMQHVPDRPHHPRRIAVCPGGRADRGHGGKRWMHWAALIEILLERESEVEVCIVGGPDDPLGGQLPESSRVCDMRGALSLAQSAWMLRHSALAVGNDCGPMHIADAVQTPCLTLFGPTCELKNGPRHKGRTLVAGADAAPLQYAIARPEGEEAGRRDLERIAPGQVADAARKFLSEIG